MLIPLDRLHAHPDNANVMPAPLLEKLQAHIQRTGRCPPLIVRPLPSGDAAAPECFQILDGHHRAMALRRLGRTHTECDVWPGIDDVDAALLLLTLNRLHGEDDPRKRGMLLEHASRRLSQDELAQLMPDDQDRIERLIALSRPPEAASLSAPEDVPPPLLAITFFLSESQHERLVSTLRAIDSDRSRALMRALALDAAPEGQAT